MSIEIEIPRYTLIREIGSGGMAVVYLATQEGLDREVAVKVLRKSLSRGGEEFRRRFEHEGRMLASLEHENIVKIFDIGSTDTSVYMVMEYLRGGTLTQKMQAGGVALQDVIKICAQIGLALHYAHRKNIIHRDLKPSNIMFRDVVTPVLTDFGIARKIDMDMTLTETGMMIGTPQYMSPEQLQGKKVDARSDIYSLGLMFYRLITGNLPFQATDPIALAMLQIQQPPEPLPEELSELQPVLDLMLAKDPDDRYASTLDFCNHLRTISLTDEEYSTQLSSATRIFTSDSFKDLGSHPSSQTRGGASTQVSSISRAFSSISTAVSAVITQKKPRYLALATVLVAVAGIWLGTKFLSHGLSEQELAAIETELNNFNAFMVLEQVYEAGDDRNATNSLLRLQQMAPDYGEVIGAANELAARYESDAWALYDDRAWDEAAGLVDSGLAFAPNNEGLKELGEKITGRIAARDLQLRINGLLQEGTAALADSRLLPGDEVAGGTNAYAAFREVRELSAPVENQQAEQGLSRVQTRIEEQVRQAWESDGRERAELLTLRGLQYFETSQTLLSLQQDIKREAEFEREQQEFERLITLAQDQLNRGELVEPLQRSALLSLRRAGELRPDDPAVDDGLGQIAQHYLEIARAELSVEELQLSLEAAANGLKAVPDDPELLLIQGNATARLDATARAIQVELQTAERLVASGLFVPSQPGAQEDSDNALAAFNRVLTLDPENAEATNGLSLIPARIETAAGQLQRAGDLEQARSLLLAASATYPDRSGFSETIRDLDTQINDRETRQRLANQLETIDELLESRPLTIALIDQISESLRNVRIEFPDEIAVTRRSNDFLRMIGAETDAVSRDGDDDTALALLDHALALYPNTPQLQNARASVDQRIVDRAEQQRLALLARSGTLAIDAAPWARVLEIRNSEQELQALPAVTETPFAMSLLEGNYTVILAAADTGEPVEVNARVTRQQVEVIRVDDSGMNAADYFERSGW